MSLKPRRPGIRPLAVFATSWCTSTNWTTGIENAASTWQLPALEPFGDEPLAVRQLERFERSPGHPWKEMVDAVEDRFVQGNGVGQ